MKIKEIQEEIVEEFSMFDDWMERYEYIIELGKNLPLIKEEFKTENNLIKGCQSKVWLQGEQKDDKINSCFFESKCQRYPRCRHEFYRRNRLERTLITHSCQWISIDDKKHKNVCFGIQHAKLI